MPAESEIERVTFPPEVVDASRIAANQAFRTIIEMNHHYKGDIRLSLRESIGLLSLVAHVGGVPMTGILEAVESGRFDAVDMLAEGKSFGDFSAVQDYMAKYHPGEPVK